MIFFRSYSILEVLIAALVLFTFSCQKESFKEPKIEIEEDGGINIPKTSQTSNYVKQQTAKWLARTCNNSQEFKNYLFTLIVDTENGESAEIFILDLLDNRFSQGLVKEAIIEANNLSEADFEAFQLQVQLEAYNLVLDVPSGLSAKYRYKSFCFFD